MPVFSTKHIIIKLLRSGCKTLVLAMTLLFGTLKLMGVPQNYYSYQNGSWNTATIWTTDPSGTTQVGSTIPGNGDIVEILPGRTVTLPANIATTNLTITIDGGGFLDLSTFQFTTGLNTLAGQGTLIISSIPAVFPTPVTTNTFVNAGGGTTEYRTNSILPPQATYNNLSINASGLTVIQTIPVLTLNGDLNVKSGTFQINDNTAQRLKLTVNGNLTVDALAFITVGTGVTNTTTNPIGIAVGGTTPFINYYDTQSHRIVLNGDFTNNGSVRFTNLTYPVYNAFPPTTLGTTSGFATVYFQGLSDNTLLCAGQTDFYNLVLDKGTDQTYKLTLYTSVNYSNFRLFGANTADFDVTGATAANPNVKKALWIRTGTLELQGTTVIPSLSEGTNPANTFYYIPANGALVLNGVDVVVQTTADDYREVNAAYGTIAPGNAAMGITQGTGNGFSLYGKLEVDNGYFSTKESEGITTTNVASGQFILNNGTVDTKQFLTTTGSASYEQYGGTMILRGRFQRTPAAFSNVSNLINAQLNTVRANDACLTAASGTFSMNNTTNVFTMGGGNLQMYDVCAPTGTTYAFQVNSSLANMNITGGTVQFIPVAGTGGTADAVTHLISSTAPFGNVVINRASSASTLQLSTAMTVLGGLTLTSGVFNANNLDVTVGGDLFLASGTSYTPGTNTTILNGSGVQTFTVNLASLLSLNNLTITKPTGIAVNMAGTQTAVNVLGNFNLTLGTLNDNGDAIYVAQNVYNSGVHTGTGKIVLNGTATQTIDGNGIFQNLELNNTNAAAAPVSLVANTTINGALNLLSNKIFNIASYNLAIGASSAIIATAFSNLCYIQSNGQSGDGGISKVYTSNSPFVFPVGCFSTKRPATYAYTPATIGFNASPTTYGSITVVPVGYEHPATTVNGQSLTFFWRVKSYGVTGIASNSVTHTFVYSPTDINGTIANYIPSLYNRSNFTWNNGLHANINTGTYTISDWTTPANSTNFLDADYTAGDGAFGTPIKFYSVASGPWTTPGTWSNTSHGTPLTTGYPTGNSIVIIEDNPVSTNTTVSMNGNVSCASLQIKAGSTLDCGTNVTNASDFGMVLNHPSGNGLIRIGNSDNIDVFFGFPSGDFSDFNINHGTTEFYNTAGAASKVHALPSSVISYGNLILNVSSTNGNFAFGNNSNTTIYGNLTVKSQSNSSEISLTWSKKAFDSYGTVLEKTVHVTGNMDIQSGIFYYQNDESGQPQHLIVDGNLNISSNAGLNHITSSIGQTLVTSTPATNTIAIGGNITNNGTFQLKNGSYYCDLTLFGNNNASITGTGATVTTYFNKVIVNKGNSQTTTLACSIGGTLNTLTDNWLTLQNGTFIYSRVGSDLSISTTTSFTIPATAGLYVNTSNNIIIGTAATAVGPTLSLSGKLILDALNTGTVFIGPDASTPYHDDIEYASAGSPTIEVNGGNLFVNGQIRRNPSITNGALTYTQTGGTVTINGNLPNTTNAKLEVLNTGSAFNMSGGTLNIIRGGGGATYGDLYLRPDASSVTGGSIVFSNNSLSGSTQNYLLDANVPLYNFTITGRNTATTANATVKLMVNPLVLNGDLTISNAQSIFDANTTNNINVTINGNFTNNGTYYYQKNLTTFSGGVQSLSGTSVTNFYDLTVNPVISLTINSNSFVNNNLTLSNGSLICGNYNVSVKANLINNANYTDNGITYGIILNGTTQQQISGTGTFGQLNLNNSAGATINNSITLNENLILTSGIFDINQYLLTLGANSIITAIGTGFSASKMVKSDGVWSNVGIKKIFSTTPPVSFIYPLGTPGKYTPTVLTIAANGSTGSIRVNNIGHHHPVVLDPLNVLNYYYEIESSGITGFSGNFLFTYLPTDVVGGPECNYYSAKLIIPGKNWSKSIGGVDCVNHKLSFNYTTVDDASITGEYTAGLDAAIPNTVPQYTSNADGNWSDNTIWDYTGPLPAYPCPIGGPNGFVVTINHVVTANESYCTAYKTYINNTLKIVKGYYGHNLGTVTGNGTLYLESPMFPAGRFGALLDCAGNGTLEYGGTDSYNITADLYSSVPNLIFSGTGSKFLPNKDLTICHQLLINGPTLDNSTYNTKLFIQGTMLLTSGAFNSGIGDNATVSFSGTTAQSVQGFTGSNAFNNLEINNSSGLTLAGPVDVDNKLLLTNGLITTSSANVLKITNFSTSCVLPDGGSTTSFVDGPLSKNLNRGDFVFKFPVGKIAYGLGNKLSLTATESSTMYWTVEYFYPNTFPTFTSPLTAINTKEYWTVNCTTPGSQAYVNVAWDPLSDLTPLMTQNGVSDMQVAEHNGTDWVQIVSTPSSGSDNYNGSVETTGLTTLVTGTRNYTLAAINAVKPKIRMSPSGSVCGATTIPVTLTTTLPIVAPFTVNYTENEIAKSITPASFPAAIPTIATGATYVLTSFTYNYPSGTLLSGVVDVTPVRVYAVPTTANAGPDQSICGATSTTLAANIPTTGSGKWSIVSGTGGTVVAPTSPTSVFNGTNGSTYILRWTISNGTCTSIGDVIISFPLLAAQPLDFSVSTPTVCQGNTGVVYTVPIDASVIYSWSYSGTGTTINGTTNVVTIDFNAIATSGILSVKATNSCNTSAARSIPITVTPTVGTPVFVLGTTSTRCRGAGTVTYTATAGNTTGITYSLDATSVTGGNSIDTGTGAVTYVMGWSGTSIITTNAAGCNGPATAKHSVTIIGDQTWTGAVSTDWNIPGNWSCSFIPNLTTNIQIPNVANKPILGIGAIGTAKNIVIDNSSSLTVIGNTLQIAGVISNSGIFTATAGTIEMKGASAQNIPDATFSTNTIQNLIANNPSGVTLDGNLNITGILKANSGGLDIKTGKFLTLLSTSGQTALIDGSGMGNVTGNVTMQRYLPSAFGYKYFSSPFQSSTVNEFANDINLTAAFPTLYKYDENHLSPTNTDISGWTIYTATAGILNPLEGYAVNFGATLPAATVDMTGVVSNSSLQVNLKNHNRTYTKGFNLVGNPYPSPIDWDKAGWTKTNVDNAIYFFNAGNTDQYTGVYSSYVNGVPSGNADNNIASMQGFFVHVTDGAFPVSATLGVTNSVRTNYLNPLFKAAIIDNRTILRFAANFETKNAIEDAAVIYFDEHANRSFNKDMDALKMNNTDLLVPNLYTLTPETKQLSINGMPFPADSITKIPLGLTTLSDGWINFKAKNISQLPSEMHLYLVDAVEGITLDLKQNPEYRFYLKTGEYNQRFTLVFSLSGINEPTEITEKMFTISRTANLLLVKVNLPINTKGNLLVTNMGGQILLRREVYEKETVEINPNVSSGVYVITVIVGKKIESEKILIRKDYE